MITSEQIISMAMQVGCTASEARAWEITLVKFSKLVENKFLATIQSKSREAEFWRKRAMSIEEQCVKLRQHVASECVGLDYPVEPVAYFCTKNGQVSCTQLTKALMKCMDGQDGRIPLYAVPRLNT